MANTQPSIYVAGHRGMVGSAIVRQLAALGHAPESIITRTHAELDLTNQAAVRAFFQAGKPAQVYLAAAKVGGIHANNTYDQHTSPMQSHINVGFGSDITIAELARIVGQVVGYQGEIDFDATKPDGAPRKLMDSRRLNALGWQAKVALQDGLTLAYKDFLNNQT